MSGRLWLSLKVKRRCAVCQATHPARASPPSWVLARTSASPSPTNLLARATPLPFLDFALIKAQFSCPFFYSRLREVCTEGYVAVFGKGIPANGSARRTRYYRWGGQATEVRSQHLWFFLSVPFPPREVSWMTCSTLDSNEYWCVCQFLRAGNCFRRLGRCSLSKSYSGNSKASSFHQWLFE